MSKLTSKEVSLAVTLSGTTIQAGKHQKIHCEVSNTHTHRQTNEHKKTDVKIKQCYTCCGGGWHLAWPLERFGIPRSIDFECTAVELVGDDCRNRPRNVGKLNSLIVSDLWQVVIPQLLPRIPDSAGDIIWDKDVSTFEWVVSQRFRCLFENVLSVIEA